MKKLMRKNRSNYLITIGISEKSVRHLPVTSQIGDVICMLSDRDLPRGKWTLSYILKNTSNQLKATLV